MGPNDQYSFDYQAYPINPAFSDFQQQPTRVTAGPTYQQTRITSGSSSAYQDYQHPQSPTQSQQPAARQWHTSEATSDGSQHAAEVLSLMGSRGPLDSRPTVASQYNSLGNTFGAYTSQSSMPHQHTSTITTTTTPPYPSTVLQSRGEGSDTTNTNHDAARIQAYPHNQGQQLHQPRPASVSSVRSAGRAPLQSPVVQIANTLPNSASSLPILPQQQVGAMTTRGNTLDAARSAQIDSSGNLDSLQEDRRIATSATATEFLYSEPAHNVQRAVSSPHCEYGETPMSNGTTQQTGSQYYQSATVDPTVTYDPWPEYQRSLEASKKAKEIQAIREAEEKQRMDEERAKDEARIAEREEARRLEEEKRADIGRRKHNEVTADAKDETTHSATPAVSIEPKTLIGSIPSPDINKLLTSVAESEDPEAQIKTLMAMVKAMNEKHPSLLAKVWQEERQEHIRKKTSLSPALTTPRQVSHSAAVSNPPVKVLNGFAAKPRAKDPEAMVGAAEGMPSSTEPTSPPERSTADQRPSGITSSEQTQQPESRPPQSAPKPASGGTIWPKEKKGQLTALAAAWLNAIPENRNRPIQPWQIGQILDQNPKYVELCERLEAIGMKFERAPFARALLSVVPPDADTPSSTSSDSPANPQPTNGAVKPIHPNLQPESSSWKATSTAATASAGITQQSSPSFDPNGRAIPLSVKKSRTSSVAGGFSNNEGTSKPASVAPEPASKKEAARKRNFADIVDLTALSEDDDRPPPPSKMQRYEYSAPLPVAMSEQVYDARRNFHQGIQEIANPNQQQHQNPDTNRPQFPPRAVDEKLKDVELVKAIKREKALRRSSYDITTIARDVLLATGKHPDMLPLNAHLEPLRLAFPKQIDFAADLETVRWDLIDPGEPILTAAGDNDGDSVLDDADDESEHEHYRGQVQAVTNRSLVGWDGSTSVIQEVHPRSFGVGKGGDPGGAPRKKRGRPPKNRTTDQSGFQSRPSGFGDEHRSPSGQHQPSDTTSKTRKAASTTSGGQATPSTRAPTTPHSAPTVPGYSAFTRTDEQGNPAKKRGRPVGWRKSLHQKGVGVYAGGSGTPASVPSNSSSLRKTAASTPKPPEVKYAVYKCKWEECKAELHNLETLIKHLNKLHGKVDEKGRFTCKWMECGKSVQVVDQTTGAIKTVQQYHYFPDFTLWAKHIQEEHVNPVAWKLGDGPPGGVSDSNATDSEAYLSDARGRRVTPRIMVPESATATPSGPAVAQRGRPHKKTSEQIAREEEAKAAKRKKAIGAGMDRGGATLANEKRRAGFVDDEEDEVIVEDE